MALNYNVLPPSAIGAGLNTAGQLGGLQAQSQNMEAQKQAMDAQAQQVQAQQAQAAKQQAAMQQGVDLLTNGTPDEIATFMFENPELKKGFLDSANFADDAAMAGRIEHGKNVLSGNANVRELYENRIKEVEAAGGDAEGLKATLATNDINVMMEEAEKDLVMLAPKAYEALKASKGIIKPEKGVFVIKETPNGWMKLNTATGETTKIKDDSKLVEAEKKKEKALLDKQLAESKTTYERAKNIRGRYDTKSKEYEKVRNSFARLEASAAEPDAAGDLALIFNFMKMLDPNASVMADDYANAKNAAGVPTQIRTTFNKLISGENLGVTQREEFHKRAKMLMAKAQNQQDKDYKQTINIAKRWNVSEEDLFGAQEQAQEAMPALSVPTDYMISAEDQTILDQINALPENERPTQAELNAKWGINNG